MDDRIYTGYKAIDNFTKGFKKEDLIIFYAKPIERLEEYIHNIIYHVACDNKKILYLNIKEEGKLSYIPKVDHENITRAIPSNQLLPEMKEIIEFCDKKFNKERYDLLVINNLDRIWRELTNRKSSNVCFQLKTLAKWLKVPIITLTNFSDYPNRFIGRILPIEAYLKAPEKTVDYMMLWYPFKLDNSNNQFNNLKNNQIETRIVNINTKKESISHLLHCERLEEVRSYSKELYNLINKVRALGLEEKDILEFAFYWENKELPE